MEPALTKKLILHKHPKQRITNEAVLTANELLRLFIVEARQRAALEAECEDEADIDNENADIDDDDDADRPQAKSQVGVSIRADHITKIAAELLMDFS